jgi:hypothetical protein
MVENNYGNRRQSFQTQDVCLFLNNKPFKHITVDAKKSRRIKLGLRGERIEFVRE